MNRQLGRADIDRLLTELADELERRGSTADVFLVGGAAMTVAYDEASTYFSSPSLRVDVASPRYLLAMKLFASRVEIDSNDVTLLYRLLGLTTVDEGLQIVQDADPTRPIHPKVQYLLEGIVADLG